MVSAILLLKALLPASGNEGVLVLPFDNLSGIEFQHYRDRISTYIGHVINDSPGYFCVAESRFKEYLFQNNISFDELAYKETLLKIAQDLNVSFFVGGNYEVSEDNRLKSYFYIKRFQRPNQITRVLGKHLEGERASDLSDTLYKLFMPNLGYFTGTQFSSAPFSVTTDMPCVYVIDNIRYDNRDFFSSRLSEGEHSVEIFHKDESNQESSIYKQNITISDNQDVNIILPVFVNLRLTSGLVCDVYINNEKAGQTDYLDKLLSGNEYLLKIVYVNKKGEEDSVFEGVISTRNYKDISLDFPATGRITISGNSLFQLELNTSKYFNLPVETGLLNPGLYEVKIFLDDKEWNRPWIFYEQSHELKPYRDLYLLPGQALIYEPHYEFCLVPSLSQFMNHDYEKGIVTALLFSGSLITMVFSGWLENQTAQRYDYVKSAFETGGGITSGYSYSDLLVLSGKKDSFTLAFNIALVTSAAVYLYSLIDGAICAKHLDKLTHPEKYKTNIEPEETEKSKTRQDNLVINRK
ncbi:MAG: hypothetical protein JXR70_09315 [Spirochaetales bacterium]|nr:hypothetical protein [Spirochaetales bacterium]